MARQRRSPGRRGRQIVAPGKRVAIVERYDLEALAGLLETLPHCRIRSGLARLDPASNDLPERPPRGHAVEEKDARICFLEPHHRGGNGLHRRGCRLDLGSEYFAEASRQLELDGANVHRVPQLALHRGDPAVLDPAGDDQIEVGQVRVDVAGTAVARLPPADVNPERGDLLRPTRTAGGGPDPRPFCDPLTLQSALLQHP